jgi:hypothetical protein
MPTIKESLESLDSMVTNHASTPEIRSQIAYILREVEALEADFVGTVRNHAQLADAHTKLKNAQLARDQEAAAENKHKVGVTLNSGVTKFYPANTYALLPNKNAPVTIEFRMADKAKHSYYEVGHAKWSEVAEVHEPSA